MYNVKCHVMYVSFYLLCVNEICITWRVKIVWISRGIRNISCTSWPLQAHSINYATITTQFSCLNFLVSRYFLSWGLSSHIVLHASPIAIDKISTSRCLLLVSWLTRLRSAARPILLWHLDKAWYMYTKNTSRYLFVCICIADWEGKDSRVSIWVLESGSGSDLVCA